MTNISVCLYITSDAQAHYLPTDAQPVPEQQQTA